MVQAWFSDTIGPCSSQLLKTPGSEVISYPPAPFKISSLGDSYCLRNICSLWVLGHLSTLWWLSLIFGILNYFSLKCFFWRLLFLMVFPLCIATGLPGYLAGPNILLSAFSFQIFCSVLFHSLLLGWKVSISFIKSKDSFFSPQQLFLEAEESKAQGISDTAVFVTSNAALIISYRFG